VTDSSSGDPIAGATILYDGGSTTTNGSGNYTISGIAAGSQPLIASADGYESSPAQNVGVPANDGVTANISLAPKPTYIAGEVRDSLTGQMLAGATISAGGLSVTTDSLGRYQVFVPPGTYTVTASKNGYIATVHTGVIVTFGTYTAADLALTPLNPPVTFSAVADAFIAEAAPTTNYGSVTPLRVVRSTGISQSSYLRFNVTGLNRAVQSAKLRLYVKNSSNQGGSVYSVSNSYGNSALVWTENGLRWDNAPVIGGTPLSTLGAVSSNTWVEFDVTAAFTGNGVYNFGIQSASTNDVQYNSREASSNQPQLVIQQSDNPLPAITGFSPASGLPGTEVTINGSGFVGITAIHFNGLAASFTVDNDKKIWAVVPAGARSGKISLSVAGGGSASEDTFDILTPPAPPAIDAFSPASGPIGTVVTIKGAGLAGATAVTFNGAPASSFTIDSDAQSRAIVPAGATNGKLSITTPAGGATSAASFVVTTSGPTTQPTYRVYVSLIAGGGAPAAKHVYTAQTAGWSESARARQFVCEVERW
jgi:hypothetical protein